MAIGFSAVSQDDDFDWWNNLHQWDGMTSWDEYLIYSPAFFGPNALPVPVFNNGRIETKSSIQCNIDSYFGLGDNTHSVNLQAYLSLFEHRMAVVIDYVPIEYYCTTEMVRDLRYSRQYDTTGVASGDLNLYFLFQLLKSKRNFDVILGVWLRTASGNMRSAARFMDTPAYKFDVNIGKSYSLGRVFDTIRCSMTAGFLCWQTMYGNHPQNDAPIYGIGMDLQREKLLISAQIGGYYGYMDNGDRPLVVRIRCNYGNFLVQYQHGIKDYPYEQVRIGYSYHF